MRNMKSLKRTTNKIITTLCILSSIFGACQKNTMENVTEENRIPVYIHPSSRIQTRVANETFENTDEIGLYLLKQPNKITEERHVDNMRFKFTQDNWTPDEIIYYPSTNELCDFIAYYPFLANAFADGSSKITCKTATDQSNIIKYAESDFLLAEKSSVAPSSEAVPLIFKHKLAEICINLKPGTGFDSIEELAETNPTISIKGVFTQGDYDIINKNFTNLSNISDIVPTGTFKADGDKLIGKYAIVIPQEITGNKIFIEVRAGGKNYNFTFGEKHVIATATKETCTLTIKRAASQSNIKAEISDWENNSFVEGDLNEVTEDPVPPVPTKSYSLSLPDFSESSVYKATDGNRQVAEICKEYLKGTGVDNQAIVVYPMNDGIADLTKGYVAQLFDKTTGEIITSDQHGGSVYWDKSTNTLNYQAGTKAPCSILYIDMEGNINPAAASATSPLTITPDIITDNRDNKSYMTVKIATQYWMKENLAAETFNDETSIINATTGNNWKSSITNAEAAYSINKSNHYYTYEAAIGKIAPIGWEVPTFADWTTLQTYINNETPLITAWEGSSNLTGMSIEETGYRDKDGKYSTTPKTSYFWNMQSGIVIYSIINNDIMKKQGNSIRCIKK